LSSAPTEGVSGRTAAGASLMIIARLGTRSIDFATLVVLGRLLSPADFGLVAIAMSVMMIVEAVSELPTFQALMRIPVLSKAHYDTGFTFAILRALALAVALCALAWPLAQLYGDPRLTALLCAAWIAPASRSLGSPMLAEFFRKFDFRPVLATELAGKSLAFLTSVSMAWYTGSYWSILVGTIVAPVSMTAISYHIAPYRPRLSLAGWHDLSGFFGWTMASQLVEAANWQMDRLILARFINATHLGRFSMADTLANVPNQVIITQVSSPLVVAFSHIRDDLQRLARAYLGSAASIVAIGVPAMVGLSLLAEPVVRLVLGKQWLETAPVLQWLSFALIPYFFIAPMAPLFIAINRVKMFLILSTAEFTLKFLLILPAVIWFGITGVVVLRLVMGVVIAIYSMFAVRSAIGLSVISQLVSPWRPILSAAAMALSIECSRGWLASLNAPLPLALGLGIVVSLSVMVYSGSLFLLWLLAGRPAGLEAKVIALLSRYSSRIFAVPGG
jgi:O-antigen/teichoic acid export membrane protein